MKTNNLLTRQQIIQYFGVKNNRNCTELEFSYTTIFCILDDLVKKLEYKDHHHATFYLTDIIMTLYISVTDTNINYSKAIKQYQVVSNKLISTSRFSHLIYQHSKKINSIFKEFINLMQYCLNDNLIMDSFPVELGKIYRESQLKLSNDYMLNLKGFNASKNCYFIGFKIMLVVDITGNLVCFSIDRASTHDLTIARELLPQLGSSLDNKDIFLDKGFIFKEEEKLDYLSRNIQLINSQKTYKKHTKEEKLVIKKYNKLVSHYRKYIETINALILNKLGRKIHATNISGFIFKLQILVFSFQIEREFIKQQKLA